MKKTIELTVMLTGKAKEHFRTWYEKQPRYTPTHVPFDRLMSMSPAIHWGVIQDWADLMGYEMWVEKNVVGFRYWYNIYEKDGIVHYNEGFKTRQEARNAAIEKLNEIINKQ